MSREFEQHVKKTHEDEQREEAMRWFVRGVLKWLFIATAVAAGVYGGVVLLG